MATIKGTQFPDELFGTAQADNIDALGGDDVIEAGGGNDVVLGGIGRDALHGDDGDDRLEGGSDNDFLLGGAGIDTMIGGLGVDTMIGGLGNDVYEVDNVRDVMTEFAGEGIDTVRTSLDDFFLGDHFENLHLTGFAHNGFGNALNNTVTGNSLQNLLSAERGNDILDGQDGNDILDGGMGDDFLFGREGNDVLQGDGGAVFGADTMVGGTGDDRYEVNSLGDVITEHADEGTDSIYSWIDYELGPNLEHVENLSLFYGSAIRATGNEQANGLEGNGLNNIINGMGEADHLVGLGGNDILHGGQGADRLEGGSGNDRLEGGANADTMIGGFGDDTYVVDDAGDVVTESGGQGVDVVRARASWAMTAGADVETLRTIDDAGVGGINLTGNASGNEVVGNNGSNVINGGNGNDSLTGLAGPDSFRFDTPLNAATNRDVITDFSVADDIIVLEDTIFGAFATGPLADDRFVLGTAAQDANDNILYDSGTGALYYDSDGNGAAAAVQFAQVGAGLPLTHLDFVIV
jgi:Ca2+-binding RTX toxin-like protein